MPFASLINYLVLTTQSHILLIGQDRETKWLQAFGEKQTTCKLNFAVLEKNMTGELPDCR